MSQPLAPEDPVSPGPRFYVTPRPRFSPGPFLLALLIASSILFVVLHAQGHSRHRGALLGNDSDDDDDDPSQVDTIYLGDPSEAPVATRPRRHPNSVHPFVVVHLPRGGQQMGQIPDTAAGRLLYAWLAAFNGTNHSAFADALPSPDAAATEAAQVELRKETGGFSLLSAREIRPGVLVFRLQDQTASANEVLGTLQVRPGPGPAAIKSFSLRALPHAQPKMP